MDQTDLDKRIAAQADRLSSRRDVQMECPSSPTGRHDFSGGAYKSSSGRKMCQHCHLVTDKPFDTLGVGER